MVKEIQRQSVYFYSLYKCVFKGSVLFQVVHVVIVLHRLRSVELVRTLIIKAQKSQSLLLKSPAISK